MDMQVTVHRFTIGRTLKDAFAVFGRNIIALMAVALLVRPILLFAPNYHFLPSGTAADLSQYAIRTAMDTLVATLIQSAVTIGVFNALRGRKATVQDARNGLRFVPLILAGQFVLIAPSLAATALTSSLPATPVLAGIGAFVLSIANFVMFLMWWLFPAVAMIERRSLFSAMARSNQLNSGQRLRVFAIFLIVGLVAGIVIWGTSLLVDVPFAMLSVAPMLTPAGMAAFVVYGAITSFFAVLATVTYYHLRLEKEGPLPDETVGVFD